MPFSPGAYLLAGCFLFAAAGCGAISFDVTQDFPLSEIPGMPQTTVAAVSTPPAPLAVNIDAEAEKQGGLANSARLKELSFTIKTPANGTFYFVTGVSISISAQGLKEIEIARLTPVPNQNTIYIKPIPDIELLPYARAGAMIKATAVGVFPREDTWYDGRVVIGVKI